MPCELKAMFCGQPTLTYSRFDKLSIVEPDASSFAIGDILLETHESGKVRPIQISSLIMDTVEQNYTVKEEEALSVVF